MQSKNICDFVNRFAKARYASFITFISLLILATTASAESEEKGIIGRVIVDGFPVIYKLVDESPSEETKAKYPWLTVFVWPYDGSNNNGMPSEALLKQMARFERRLEKLVDEGHSVRAYSRTGKNLKELAYFIHDQDEFMAALDEASSNDLRYPINIDFFKDEPWEGFNKLRSSIQPAPGSQ